MILGIQFVDLAPSAVTFTDVCGDFRAYKASTPQAAMVGSTVSAMGPSRLFLSGLFYSYGQMKTTAALTAVVFI